MIDDLRYGSRIFFRHPALSLIAIVTLALGIGATATIFSIVDAQLVQALPFSEPDRLMLVREVGSRGGMMSVAEPNFEDLKVQSQSFSSLALTAGGNLVVAGGREVVRTRVSYASEQFFNVFAVQPLIGRTFAPEETKYGGPAAALVSYGYWQRLLGSRTDLENVKPNIDGASCNVVGVMPQGFTFPAETEVWVTRAIEPPNTSRTAHNWTVIGRLRSDVPFEQARTEVSTIGKRLKNVYGEKMNAVDFAIIPLQQYLTRDVRTGLLLLLGAVGMLLLVACANVSNLILARLMARSREFAVRRALGITRLRLIRQLVIENLTLTIPASLIGTLLAAFGVEWLLSLDHGRLPVVNPIAVNSRVVIFALVLGVLIAIALAAITAVDVSRQDIQAGLSRVGLRRTFGVRGGWLRTTLAIAQIALTLVLLTGAGLLANSFLRVVGTDPGFATSNAMAMTMALPSTVSVAEDEQLRQFYSQLLTRIEQTPGVIAAGGINSLPLTGRGSNGTFRLEGDEQFRGEAEYRVASAGYFRAMGIPLLSGRYFGSEDTVNSPHVAIISQSLARKYWRNENPIGKRIQFGNMDTDKRVLNVVGIVGDVKDGGLDAAEEATIYAYSLQRPQWWQVARLSIVVRYQGTAMSALTDSLRSSVRSLRSDVPLTFRTLDQVVTSSLGERRFNLVLFGVFALTALVIASIGIYGIVSHGVTQRTHEIGIRLALGAETGHILRIAMRDGIVLVAAGVSIGLAGALALTRLLRSFVYGVGVTDPSTFTAVALLITVVILLACYLPARRATRVDPLTALRYE
jgi:putative ABC transport system permease protein